MVVCRKRRASESWMEFLFWGCWAFHWLAKEQWLFLGNTNFLRLFTFFMWKNLQFQWLCINLPCHSCAESPERGIWGGNWHIHIIKAYLALWFWHSENFATSMVSQKQGNENASWVYSITAIVGSWCICAPPKSQPFGIYIICIHIRGAFSVARFDLPGNAKAFRMWNEWQDLLHVLCFCMIANNNRQGGAIGTNPILGKWQFNIINN